MQGERDVIYSPLEYLNWHDHTYTIFDAKRATRKQ